MFELGIFVEEKGVPEQGENHEAQCDSSNTFLSMLAASTWNTTGIFDLRMSKLINISIVVVSLVMAREKTLFAFLVVHYSVVSGARIFKSLRCRGTKH